MAQYTIINRIKLKTWHETSSDHHHGSCDERYTDIDRRIPSCFGWNDHPPFDLGTFYSGNVSYGTHGNSHSRHFFHLQTIAPGKPCQTSVASLFLQGIIYHNFGEAIFIRLDPNLEPSFEVGKFSRIFPQKERSTSTTNVPRKIAVSRCQLCQPSRSLGIGGWWYGFAKNDFDKKAPLLELFNLLFVLV